MINPVAENERFRTLCRNLFSSGDGKELIESLSRIYCDGKLYQETDRATIYAIAQRDLVLELKDITRSGVEKANGVEVS